MVHLEIGASVLHEAVVFDEAAWVAEHLDALPGSKFALKTNIKLKILTFYWQYTKLFRILNPDFEGILDPFKTDDLKRDLNHFFDTYFHSTK